MYLEIKSFESEIFFISPTVWLLASPQRDEIVYEYGLKSLLCTMSLSCFTISLITITFVSEINIIHLINRCYHIRSVSHVITIFTFAINSTYLHGPFYAQVSYLIYNNEEFIFLLISLFLLTIPSRSTTNSTLEIRSLSHFIPTS